MIPTEFLERMKAMLGDEFADFKAALEKSAERGYRINTLKCDIADFSDSACMPSEPLGYVKGGFRLLSDSRGIGNSPTHHSGRIYIQDPGAMASSAAIDIKEGMWVADLCAAPGGKSTELAARLAGTGFILSNEYVPKRAKILVGNFERMGIRNGIVTSLDTSELARLFPFAFDAVVADAPCSGEGMLRKDVPAAEEWSVENIAKCKERQAYILDNAAKMVRGGGSLLYSTCTYSLEENEMTVDEFLIRHPDFELIALPDDIAAASSDGIQFVGAVTKNLHFSRRFYPHKSKGEGQFIALMRRRGDEYEFPSFKSCEALPTKEEKAAVLDFFKENLKKIPEGRIAKVGNNLVLISHGCPIPPRSVFSAGVLLGELRGRTFIPRHQFFSCYGDLFIRQENITDEALALKYIRGEEIPATFGGSGFCSVLYRSSPLGGGKASSGMIKNHYPKGLRNN